MQKNNSDECESQRVLRDDALYCPAWYCMINMLVLHRISTCQIKNKNKSRGPACLSWWSCRQTSNWCALPRTSSSLPGSRSYPGIVGKQSTCCQDHCETRTAHFRRLHCVKRRDVSATYLHHYKITTIISQVIIWTRSSPAGYCTPRRGVRTGHHPCTWHGHCMLLREKKTRNKKLNVYNKIPLWVKTVAKWV